MYIELFLDGKFECSGVLADSLCKLLIRLKPNIDNAQFMALRTRVLLIFTSILRLGGSKYVTQPIDRDSAERIALCIQILINSTELKSLETALTLESEKAFNSILKGEERGFKNFNNNLKCKIDDPIKFSLIENLKKKTPVISSDESINLIINDSSSSISGRSSANLNRVVQLTGFSDAIYAETYVQMSGKEVFLDLLLVNQTEETLQNVSIDLVCAGDLKLMEKPVQLILPPFSFSACKSIFKVTSTNHGQIFGCISYLSGPTGQDSESVILSEIKIDVLEYIKAAQIDETEFRDIWVLLEWENKISIKVQRNTMELEEFLDYLIENGHLTCITPNVFISDDASTKSRDIPSFLACNLYAKSIFGKNKTTQKRHLMLILV